MLRAIRGAPARSPRHRRAVPAPISPERFAAVEAERSRLAIELEEAQRRASAAEAAAAATGAETQARVAALVLAVHQELLEAQAFRKAVLTPGRPNEPGPRLTATATRNAPHRRGIRRFLYVDTVLPLLAVVIVLVLLLAWMD